MKRFIWLLSLSVLVVPIAAFAQTDDLLLSFEGFDYEFPDDDPNEFGAAGDWYNMFGFVQDVNETYITADFDANEYTIEFYNLWSEGFSDFGDFRFITYTDGMVQVYEDDKNTGTAAVHGTNPPNATVPTTFVDGTLILGGDVNGFVITLNMTLGTGDFSGDVDFNSGSQVGNIPPTTDRVYTFAGLTGVESAGVPEGYVHQVSGEIRIEQAVPSEESTWGRMKALYR